MKEYNRYGINSGTKVIKNEALDNLKQDIKEASFSEINLNEEEKRFMIASNINQPSHLVWWDRLELVFAITLLILIILINLSQAVMAGGLTWFVLLIPFAVAFLVTIIRGH